MPTQKSSSVPNVSAQTKAMQQMRRLQIRLRFQADRNGVLIAGGIMAGAGWAMLYQLISTTKPLAFPRWLFFILLYIAITGTVLPLIWVLNQRFSRYLPVSGGILLRQAMWCGLFVVAAAWLQMIRALTLPIAFFLGLSMVAIEVFLRIRERAQAYAERTARDLQERAE